MIPPPLRPDPRAASLSFHIRAPNSEAADSISVLLSTGGATPGDFSTRLLTIALSELPTDSFTSLSLSLAPFASDTVCVAFVLMQQSQSCTVLLDNVAGPAMALPVPPANPQPPDASPSALTVASLSWNNGFGTLSVDVYVSQNATAVQTLDSAARVLTAAAASEYWPPSNFIGGRTYFWRVVAHGAEADAVGPVWSFTAGPGPLSGSYRLGANGDFATFSEALAALTNGVSGPTEFLVSAGIYNESLLLTTVSGASGDARVSFRRASPDSAVTILGAGGTDTCTVILLGANFFTLDGIDIIAQGSGARHGIVIGPGSSNNTIRRAIITGTGATVSGSDGVYLRGPGTNFNTLDSVTVRQAVRGFHFESAAGTVCTGNIIEQCVTDSVRCGAYVMRQGNCQIRGNRFSVNAGSYDEVDGVIVATTMPGDTVFVHGNRMDRLATAGAYAVGLRVRTDSASAVVRAYNNMICDFANSGTSQVRALYTTSGRCEFVANSILVNDVPATGTTYCVYLGTVGSGGRTVLKNNILANREATSLSYGVFSFLGSTSLESDYNIFHGTGAQYRAGRWGSDRVTLTDWQQASSGDAHSLAGDPGFVSLTDLHIAPASGLPHQNGAVINWMNTDVDGDTRLIPPDRGADEYTYDAPPADFALLGFVDLASSYVEYTPIPLRIVVHNRGSQQQRGVPVQLFCNGELHDESRVGLEPLAVDTVTLYWNTGAGDSLYTVRAQCGLDGDAEPGNDSASALLLVVRPPLTGGYVIGEPGSPYPDFSSAVYDLALRGVSEPVVFEIAPGSYTEQITIPPIPGASETNRITFRPVAERAAVTITSENGPATIVLDGADYVVLDGLDLRATGNNPEGIRLTGDADGNLISGVSLTGPSLLMSTAIGIHTVGGGNDDNVIHDATLQGFYYAVRLEGSPSLPDRRNLVERSTVVTSRIGIRTDYQDSTRIRANTVRTGYEGAAAACHGIYLGPSSVGAVVFVDANRLSGGRGSAALCGIYVNSPSGLARVTNNMIGGWTVTGAGTVYGILAAAGQAALHFNSVWMNDISGSGNVIAIADTGASVTARNNALQITESTNGAWCWYRSAGTLDCDYTAFSSQNGGNPQFRIGRWGTTDYSTLAQWQAATGMDAHGLSGDIGFTDSLDLHVQGHMPLLNESGVPVAGVETDFDGDVRESVPDIGADEYFYAVHERDFRAEWLSPPLERYSAGTDYAVAVRARNIGLQPYDEVPVRLFYRDSLVAEAAAAANPGGADTVVFLWQTPVRDLESGSLRAQTFLEGDEDPQNDAVAAAVTVIGPPLAGSYDCGGGVGDFSDPLNALTHLSLRGVADSVTVNIFPGVYADSMRWTEIAGAGALRRVVFRGAGVLPSAVVLTTSTGRAVVELAGTDYTTLENLSVIAAGSCTTAVLLRGGACHNVLRNCVLRGADSVRNGTVALRIEVDSNDSNLVDRVTVGGAFTGIALDGGASGTQSRGNTIQRCTIRHARYGIYAARQSDCLLDRNDIQPGSFSDLAAACYGVYVAALGSGGSVTVCNNQIHDFADNSLSTVNRAVGIYSAPAAGAGVIAYNNFIYGFDQVSRLKISAIYLSSGENTILHNSVLVTDAPTTNEISCVYISTGSGQVVKNNILISLEDDVTSYGVLQMGGTLISDGNDIWGASPLFVTGRIAGINYSTFAAWQAAGYDPNGISADPVFHSASDLHVVDTVAVVDGRAVPTGLVTTDIDGEIRAATPDIGADEYTVLPPPLPPHNVTIAAFGDSVRLIWSRVDGAATYHVYSDSVAQFEPLPAFRKATTADTFYVVAVAADSGARRFFVVTSDRRPLPPGQQAMPADSVEADPDTCSPRQ